MLSWCSKSISFFVSSRAEQASWAPGAASAGKRVGSADPQSAIRSNCHIRRVQDLGPRLSAAVPSLSRPVKRQPEAVHCDLGVARVGGASWCGRHASQG